MADRVGTFVWTGRSLGMVSIVVGCGGAPHSAPTLANAGEQGPPATTTVAVPPLPPAPVCDARLDIPTGLHDRYMFSDESLEKVGFKDKAGKIVIPAIFVEGYPFTPGGVAAMTDGVTPFVFIDTSGKTIAKAYAFDNGPDYYQEGFARVVGKDGRIGYISESTGKIEIPAEFDMAYPFCEGRAEVEQGGQTFVIDRTGKRIP